MMQLTALGQTRLDLDEASGLAHDAHRALLWSVSDDAGRAYAISLAGGPRLVGRLELQRGGKHDLEGITVAPDGESLLIVAEKRRRVLRYGLDGHLMASIALDLPEGRRNAGLEGISLDTTTNRLFAVNQDQPRLLVELDDDLAVAARWQIEDLEDLSGVCAHRGSLWIVSAEAGQLARYAPRDSGGFALAARYSIGREGCEGVAVVGDRIYVTFDLRNGDNLAWYALPDDT